MIEFHKTLSDRSVYFRYFGILSFQERTLHERLRRVCFIDYDWRSRLARTEKNHDGTLPDLWSDD